MCQKGGCANGGPEPEDGLAAPFESGEPWAAVGEVWLPCWQGQEVEGPSGQATRAGKGPETTWRQGPGRANIPAGPSLLAVPAETPDVGVSGLGRSHSVRPQKTTAPVKIGGEPRSHPAGPSQSAESRERRQRLLFGALRFEVACPAALAPLNTP